MPGTQKSSQALSKDCEDIFTSSFNLYMLFPRKGFRGSYRKSSNWNHLTSRFQCSYNISYLRTVFKSYKKYKDTISILLTLKMDKTTLL